MSFDTTSDEVVDIEGASKITFLPVSTLRHYRWKNAGPPSFVVSRRLLYRVSELREWMAKQELATKRGDNL